MVLVADAMSINAMNIALSFFTGLVVLGVFLEGAEYFEAHPWGKWLHGKVVIWSAVGFLILVFGLAGEWLFQSKISQYENDRIVALSPRNIDSKARAGIANACSDFAGHDVEVISISNDAEGFRLATEIMEALKAAKLHVINGLGNTMPIGGLSFGVTIRGAELPLVSCLRDALHDIGRIDVTAPTDTPGEGETTVFVGLKPVSD